MGYACNKNNKCCPMKGNVTEITKLIYYQFNGIAKNGGYCYNFVQVKKLVFQIMFALYQHRRAQKQQNKSITDDMYTSLDFPTVYDSATLAQAVTLTTSSHTTIVRSSAWRSLNKTSTISPSTISHYRVIFVSWFVNNSIFQIKHCSLQTL